MNNDHGRRFAVYSPTGVHIGLWPDGKIAAEVAAETPGNTVEELIRADHVDALLKAEREKALREAAEVCERIREQKINGPMPERACFDYEQSIRALAEKE